MANFLTFINNNEFYKIITQQCQQSENSYFLIKDRVDKFFTLDRDRQQDELELYHKLFKHARGCEETDCTVSDGCELLSDLIIQAILPQTQVLSSYPLLVCLIDLVKNDSATLDKNTLLSLTCHLWQDEKIYMCRKSMELCKRIMPLLENGNDVLSCVVNYILVCRENLTLEDMERIQSLDYTEFFYSPSTSMTFDRECIKLLVQIVLSVFLYHPMDQVDCTHEFIVELKDLTSHNPDDMMSILFDICCANDDDTVQLLDTTLAIYQQGISMLFLNFLKEMNINPHTLFFFFLSRCGNNHNIIIDLLLEDDSNFLSYFCKYLVYANQDIHGLISALNDEKDTFSTILANTILVLEGDGFPYNTKPLIRRLILLDENLNKLPI